MKGFLANPKMKIVTFYATQQETVFRMFVLLQEDRFCSENDKITIKAS